MPAIIRHYEPRDREAVRAICRKTAYRNRGSASVFEDDELFADYWTSYYTDYEPQSTWVLERDGAVIGYLAGCADSLAFRRVMARRIVPAVVGKALWRLATGRYRQRSTRRMLWWMLSRGFREEPPVPLDRFPAHYHINFLRQGYGGGNFSRMVTLFLDRLDEMGVRGIHSQAEEAMEGGGWRKSEAGFRDQEDFPYTLEHYAETPSTFQSYVLGIDKPMVNRVWGTSVFDYRQWVMHNAARYNM